MPTRLTVRLVRDVAALAVDAAGLGLAMFVCLVGHDWQWHATSIGKRVWCDRCGKQYKASEGSA